jgi:hypothetical protein
MFQMRQKGPMFQLKQAFFVLQCSRRDKRDQCSRKDRPFFSDEGKMGLLRIFSLKRGNMKSTEETKALPLDDCVKENQRKGFPTRIDHISLPKMLMVIFHFSNYEIV